MFRKYNTRDVFAGKLVPPAIVTPVLPAIVFALLPALIRTLNTIPTVLNIARDVLAAMLAPVSKL